MKAVLVFVAVCMLCASVASAEGKEARGFFFDTMGSMVNTMASGMNSMMGKMTDMMNCAADVMMLKGCHTNNNSNIVQPVTVTTQMPTDTSKTSTAVQTESLSTTQETSLRAYPCNKYQSINVIAHGSYVVNKRATVCNPEDRNNPDALVTRLCAAPNVTTWQAGVKVMDFCDRIPLFSAVATFVNNHHYTGGYSGIFAGCLKNGFKMILQTCQNAPTVIHITMDTNTNVDYNTDPINYYVLNW